MYTKRQRINTWIFLAGISISFGIAIVLLAEIYFPQTWFHTIALFFFAGGSLLSIVSILLPIGSLTVNDYQESKITATFVNLGPADRVISVHHLANSIVHLPVTGTVNQSIIAPDKSQAPYVSKGTVEHVHMSGTLPHLEVIDDDLYQQLFGQQ